MKNIKKFFTLFVFIALFLSFIPQRVSASVSPLTTVIPISNTSIRIDWSSVDGASGYEVYRSTSSTGTYSRITTTSASTTTYTNTRLTTGTTYHYKVRSYTTSGTTKVYGNYSEGVSVKSEIPAAPGSLTAATASETSINISWSAVNGAIGYEIYRSSSSTGTYSKVTIIDSTSYIDTGLITGTTYYYKVRAYTTAGTAEVYGAYSVVVNSIANKIPAGSASIVAIPISNTSTKIAWDPVDGASGYEVYRSTLITGPYSLITTTSASTTTYTNTRLITGTTYYYKVRAYTKSGTKKVYGNYSEVASAKAAVPAAPGELTAATASETSINISWSEVNEANGYEIYRSTSSAGTYSKVTTTESTSYIDTGLTTGTKYYYKVRAYTTLGSTEVYGAYSVVVNSIAYKISAASESITAIPVSNTSMRINWDSIDGASGYEVYRSTSSTGAYSLITTTSASTTTYTNTNLIMGTTYYYKVRAYVTVASTKVYGYYSEVVGVKVAIPSTPLVTASAISSTSTRISWGAVNEANGYEIYRATSSSGPYELSLSDSTSTSYTDINLNTGTTYYYKVRAYTTVGMTQVYGGYSSVVSVKPTLVTPVATAVVASNTSIRISWGAVDGAEGYDIYRATSSAGPYTLSLPNANSTSYTNSSLSPGTTYYYKVRAYTTVGTTQVYGDYSVATSAKPVLSTPLVMASMTSGTSVGISWGAVDGASGYEIYRSTSINGKYKEVILTATYTGHTDTGLIPGTTYYYKVRAYSTISGALKSYGDYSSVVSSKPTLGIPLINEPIASDTGIAISWSTIKGVSGYDIYRATSIAGPYNQISTTTSSAYTDKTASTAITYYYKVCAYATVGKVKAYGNYSEVVSIFAKPATPLITAVPSSSNSIKITWSTVKGASGYEIYTAASSTGAYTLLNSTSLKSLTVLDCTAGNTYYYKVRAYAIVGTSKVYGDYSSVVGVTP